jgi:[ribosomal protein S18]-alanine N-acetyltransferase
MLTVNYLVAFVNHRRSWVEMGPPHVEIGGSANGIRATLPGMPPLEIVAADDEDRRWAAAIMAGSEPWIALGRGLDRCLRLCCDRDYLVFVARQNGERRGVIVLQSRGVAGSPYVVSLACAPEARGLGIGGQLLTFAETLVHHEATHLFLCVSSFNERARRFYERHGYVVVGELEDYVIAGASELLMSKRLTPA